jgi:ABC-type bacteriocin/lantibiotic exporter with double-glycine peptidase domain
MHPAKVPGVFAPVKQTEPHTCGYCGIVAIYNAYGLDHQAAGLRFRLGTDVQLNQLVDSSTGTIPPDMTRVLEQDGFTTQTVSAANDQMAALTLAHLRVGHPALAVIKVTGLHWVVLTAEHDGQVTVCDSLHDELYTKPTDAYLKDEVYGVMLVKPAE